MGRPLRIEYPGAFYHVTSRGNERRAIFLTQKNYERMIGYLESATERYGAQIHCFCLMSNHYHLLLETPRGISVRYCITSTPAIPTISMPRQGGRAIFFRAGIERSWWIRITMRWSYPDTSILIP